MPTFTPMPQSQASLLTFLQQAEADRDAAQTRHARAGEAVQRLTEQAEQLLAYRDDYRRRAPALGAQAASMEIVRCHRDFMQRLEQAIDQQRGQLEAARRQAVAEREALLAQEQRLASVRKLLERRHAAEQRLQARAEQRRNDEAAQRAAWARRSAVTQF